MPPLRTDRVSKACTTCRRQKTRCYRSENGLGTCLRCKTLKQRCSLEPSYNEALVTESPCSRPGIDQDTSVNQRYACFVAYDNRGLLTMPRLDRLESALGKLVEKIDSHLDVVTPVSNTTSTDGRDSVESFKEPSQAPVILIRDAATEIGIRSPNETFSSPAYQTHVLSKGLLSYSEAYQLMST